MGKLLLSAVLLIMVVAVSYIQAVRRQTKVDNSFQLGKKSSQIEVLALQSAADSLRTRIGQQEVVHSESLLQRDKLFQQNVDSLAQIIGAQQQDIVEMKMKKAPTKPSVTQNTADADKRHRELLAFYKKRFDSLPLDLTEYERKVAVSEIRQETATKYTITLVEFNRIRDRHKLNY